MSGWAPMPDRQMFYSEGKANREVAETLARRFGFRTSEVLLAKAKEDLPRVKGFALLVWGGEDHHLSHFFELRGGKKIVLDGRLDVIGEVGVNPQSHAEHSRDTQRQVLIYVPSERGGYQVGHSSGEANGAEHAHLSLHLNYLACFPADEMAQTSGTFYDLMEFLGEMRARTQMPQLMRVDMGGLKHDATTDEMVRALDAYSQILERIMKKL